MGSGVGRISLWGGFSGKFCKFLRHAYNNSYNIWWLFLVVSKIFFLVMSQKISKFLILFFKSSQIFNRVQKCPKFLMIFFFSHVQKNFPIIQFLHFWHCIQFCSIYLKIFSWDPMGGFNPQNSPLPTPLCPARFTSFLKLLFSPRPGWERLWVVTLKWRYINSIDT